MESKLIFYKTGVDFPMYIKGIIHFSIVLETLFSENEIEIIPFGKSSVFENFKIRQMNNGSLKILRLIEKSIF